MSKHCQPLFVGVGFMFVFFYEKTKVISEFNSSISRILGRLISYHKSYWFLVTVVVGLMFVFVRKEKLISELSLCEGVEFSVP